MEEWAEGNLEPLRIWISTNVGHCQGLGISSSFDIFAKSKYSEQARAFIEAEEGCAKVHCIFLNNFH